MRRSGVILAVALCVCACSGPSEQAPATRKFSQPAVPSMLEGQERAEFVVEHYWDNFLDTATAYLCDSSHVAGLSNEALEQAFANYTAMLDVLPLDEACKDLRSLYSSLPKGYGNMFSGLMGVAERYLYDPNSPLRNEDYWQSLASSLAGDPDTPDSLRQSYCQQASRCLLNRVGTPAADFMFCDREGRMASLYEIEAEYTLLFFSNPGCEACKEIIDNLRASGRVSQMIASGVLAVVNVYIDEDVEAWYGYMSYYPVEWHNGYDPNLVIRNDSLYDVRAIPSLYLLDKNKTVLLKDAPAEKVFNFIETKN